MLPKIFCQGEHICPHWPANMRLLWQCQKTLGVKFLFKESINHSSDRKPSLRTYIEKLKSTEKDKGNISLAFTLKTFVQSLDAN